MNETETTARYVEQFRHLLGDDDRRGDFVFPSLLKEVPSVTSTGTSSRNSEVSSAELGGRSKRNSD